MNNFLPIPTTDGTIIVSKIAVLYTDLRARALQLGAILGHTVIMHRNLMNVSLRRLPHYNFRYR